MYLGRFITAAGSRQGYQKKVWAPSISLLIISEIIKVDIIRAILNEILNIFTTLKTFRNANLVQPEVEPYLPNP